MFRLQRDHGDPNFEKLLRTRGFSQQMRERGELRPCHELAKIYRYLRNAERRPHPLFHLGASSCGQDAINTITASKALTR
jgi:hypothetical protein